MRIIPVTAEPPSRRRRRITRIVAAVWLLVGIGSCTSILDVEQYADVTEEMCSLLDRCSDESENAGCRTDLKGHLSDADPRVRALWLQSITDRSCLDSCSAGRICLDLEPLCSFGGACTRPQNCCGSLEGHATCEDGSCCATRGSACTVDTDCCSIAGACDPRTHTCGGKQCTEADQPCTLDIECCTRRCNDRSCAKTTCNANKFDCLADEDCCSDFCDPVAHVCAERPTCNEAGTACAVETDCCKGTHCFRAAGTIAGTCAAESCSLDLLDCATDDQCCSGHCDPVFFFCSTACSYADHACAVDSDCCAGHCDNQVCKGSCSTSSCDENEDCCSGSCVEGTCASECGPAASHSPCASGGPLHSDEFNKPCIEAICKADAYCCCGAWDELCVNAALNEPLCTGNCN